MDRVRIRQLYLSKDTVAKTGVVWWGRIDDGREVIPREEWQALTEEQRRRVLDGAHLLTTLSPEDITVKAHGDFDLNWPEILKCLSAPEEPKKGFAWRKFLVIMAIMVVGNILFRLVFK